jgi:hypothetical protein
LENSPLAARSTYRPTATMFDRVVPQYFMAKYPWRAGEFFLYVTRARLAQVVYFKNKFS